MGCIYRAENCKNHFKIVGKIIFKKKMMWQLMWRNVRVAVLNATLQLLVIYKNKIAKVKISHLSDYFHLANLCFSLNEWHYRVLLIQLLRVLCLPQRIRK